MVQEHIDDGLCLFDLNKCSLDLSCIENRRFMYHPDGWMIFGAEAMVASDKLLSSHAEEYYDATEGEGNDNVSFPPFDEFVRGWIGVGGAYKNGIVHFAPNIPEGNVEAFDKAFSFVEAVLENGFTEKTVLRGFPGKWEQTIGEMFGVDRSLDKQIQRAKRRRSIQDVKSCEIKDREI